MSYQEKKSIATILGTLPIIIFYIIYTVSKQQAGIDLANDLGFWGRTMLITIGIGIVVTIVTLIVFHIINAVLTQGEEADPGIEDELDKLVELKSDRFSFILVGIGFMAALVTLVLSMPPAVMLNIIFFSFYLGSIIGEIAKIYFYRRGV